MAGYVTLFPVPLGIRRGGYPPLVPFGDGLAGLDCFPCPGHPLGSLTLKTLLTSRMVLTFLTQSAASLWLLGSTFHDVLRVAPQVLRQKVHEAAAIGIKGRLRAACASAPKVRAVIAEGRAATRRRTLKAVAAAALATKVVAVQVGTAVP